MILDTEDQIRDAFEKAIAGRDLRGFWHTKIGRNIRAAMRVVPFADFSTEQEKSWALTNSKSVRPTCIVCGTRPSSFYQYSYLETCGDKAGSCGQKLAARNQSDEIKAATLLRIQTAAQTPAAKTKRKATMTNTMLVRGSEIQDARSATCIDRYGVDHSSKTESHQARTAATNMERYGHRSTLAATSLRAKRNETLRAAYEQNILPQWIKIYRGLGYTALFTRWEGQGEMYKWRHTCGHEFEHRLTQHRPPVCRVCRPRSMPEFNVLELCRSFTVQVKPNDRTLIRPLELDMFLPEHNVAIEVNGAYWHHDAAASRPLVEKTRMCADVGIRLLHFWDFETLNLAAVRHTIGKELGLFDTKVLAMSTEPKSSEEATAFYADNGYGSRAGEVNLGIASAGEVVGMISLTQNVIVGLETVVSHDVTNLVDVIQSLGAREIKVDLNYGTAWIERIGFVAHSELRVETVQRGSLNNGEPLMLSNAGSRIFVR